MDNPIVIFLILAVIGGVGLVVIFLATPVILQMGTTLEGLALLGEAIDEFFNRPGLFRIGCLFVFLSFGCCCVLIILLMLVGASCLGPTPPTICRLIGR